MKLPDNIKKDWMVYAALLLALVALLYTWGHQAQMEADIRAEYESYITLCKVHDTLSYINYTPGVIDYDYTTPSQDPPRTRPQD